MRRHLRIQSDSIDILGWDIPVGGVSVRSSTLVAYLSSVFKYECELKLFFLYELSVRDLPVWTVCLVSTKSRENLEYDKVQGC
jgi:hypothetical protein